MSLPPRQPPNPTPINQPGATPPNAPQTGNPPNPTPSTQTTPNTSPQSEVQGVTTASPINSRLQLQKDWDEDTVFNSILDGTIFQPNLVNKYNNVAHHWRLFCMADKDFMWEGAGLVTDIKDFYQRLDQNTQVNICETGVTGYNINHVEMSSMFGDTQTRGSQFTEITMKVNEPNGVSFLDALAQAATDAGITNYIDFFYYLELTFKAYTVDGDIDLTPFSDLPNGGRWIWTVRINNIDVNLGTGGGQYVLSMIPINQHVLDSEWSTVPDTLLVRGETIQEFFKELSALINLAWNKRMVVKDVTKKAYIDHQFLFHGIQGSGQPPPNTSPTAAEKAAEAKLEQGQTGDQLKATKQAFVDKENQKRVAATVQSKGITGAQILNMKLRPSERDWSSIRNVSDFAFVEPNKRPNANSGIEAAPAGAPDKPTANIPKGTSIPDILNMIMAACEPAQALARDSQGDPMQADDSSDIVNAKGFRECVTWQVIPEVRFNRPGEFKYDYYTNRYGRTIIWHIYPVIDQEPILSHQQITKAFDPKSGFQKSALTALAARGFLPKRYDYLFTGINTEVLNFDLNFNFVWSVSLPRFEQYYSDQKLAHVKVSPLLYLDQLRENETNLRADVDRKKRAQLQTQQSGGTVDATDQNDLQQQELQLQQIDQLEVKQQALATAERAKAETNAQQIFGARMNQPLEQGYNREYVEGQLNARNSENSTSTSSPFANSRLPLIPFSFSGGDETKQQIGYGNTGQWHNGRLLYGSILEQQYGPVAQRFQQIEMTIRGDPFWIGFGSYEDTINHQKVSVIGSQLAYTFIGQNTFVFRFKYPTDADASGNIVLKNNETVTGVYKVIQVKNTFQGGTFTQTLSAIRLPLLDLTASIFGLNQDGDENVDPNDTNTPPTTPAPVPANVPTAAPAVATPSTPFSIPIIPVRGG